MIRFPLPWGRRPKGRHVALPVPPPEDRAKGPLTPEETFVLRDLMALVDEVAEIVGREEAERRVLDATSDDLRWAATGRAARRLSSLAMRLDEYCDAATGRELLQRSAVTR